MSTEEAALGAGLDREHAAEFLDAFGEHAGGAADRARAKAAEILGQRWVGVEAVAEALLYPRTIDGDEISGLAPGEWTLRDCVALRLKWGGVRGLSRSSLRRGHADGFTPPR